ncbi:hypothetical protein BDZ90DRAFT_89751 [Jaminaea rosea]|uniref:Uncharacterized protein n=1 Tax=Jaminaea rosea TaxID=1569628 RepID=A0A316UHY2_9BASI|nr:hypothetical protein BDZ90DRAFT_89751 [Jaminaea rosea]PWN24947.1 hypothetical protein BDZ90DRAFT_89751 [Jaminaea rosea]
MRFTLAVPLLALAGAVSASPIKRESDVDAVGTGLCYLEAGLGVTSLTDFLDTELGGAISALEKMLGVTKLEESIGLSGCKTDGLSDVELVGKSLCYLEKGLGVTSTSDFLDSELGGAVSAIEDKLGVTSIEDAIKATDC